MAPSGGGTARSGGEGGFPAAGPAGRTGGSCESDETESGQLELNRIKYNELNIIKCNELNRIKYNELYRIK